MADSLEIVAQVAEALGSLRSRMVFLGGAATPLLITDPGAPMPRATADVDVIIEVSSTIEYQSALGDELRRLGFREDAQGPICRWLHGDMVVDVMPTDPSVLGYTNRWYGPAIRVPVRRKLREGLIIQHVTAPHFLGTKLEAFKGRGRGDLLASHDMEDLIALIDGRRELLDEVHAAEPDLQTYLQDHFSRLLSDPAFEFAVSGHLPGDVASQGRASTVLDRIRSLSVAPDQ